MKVNIGPYRGSWSSFGFERWYFDKKYGESSWEMDENKYTQLDKSIVYICSVWQKVLNKTINKYLERPRDIKVKIHDYDVWSMDHTLALIVHPMLLKLKAQKHGSPFVDSEDVPEHLHPDPNRAKMHENGEIEEWDIDNTIHDRWAWVLDEMIHAFECEVDDEWERQFESGEVDFTWEKDEETGHSTMGKGPNHTFVVDREAMDKAWARRKNGLRLFAKYYHGLWD
jgi:hypothetical protein